MRFLYKEKKVRNGYITAFGLLTISYFIVLFIILQVEKRARLVNFTSEMVNKTDILLSCIKNAEISFRNYVMLNDFDAKNFYDLQTGCVNSSLASLSGIIADDGIQKSNLDTIIDIVQDKQTIYNEVLVKFEGGVKYQPVDNLLLQSGQLTEQIRIIAIRMQMHETMKLAKTNEFETTSKTLKIVHLCTFIMALLLATYSLLVYNNISREKFVYREKLEQNIEELKKANNDLVNLRSAEKFAASGRIVRTIAHEIRNPLTSISLAAEQLTESAKSDDDKTLLEIVNRNITRIHNLIVELLNSTKFSQLNLSKQSLNRIIDDALELAKDRVELNSVSIKKSLSPNPCYVEVDCEKMRTAFLNILINAIEAMEPGKGVLDITTIRNHNKCHVIIKDNGIGMNESSLSRIFEPYFTQKEFGNGLGLTLTQNIILNHQGNIIVESIPKKGSTFTITLNEHVQ